MPSPIRLLAIAALVACAPGPAGAQQPQPSAPPPQIQPGQPQTAPETRVPQYSSNEILDSGHRFFGGVSRGLAQIVEKAFSEFGVKAPEAPFPF